MAACEGLRLLVEHGYVQCGNFLRTSTGEMYAGYYLEPLKSGKDGRLLVDRNKGHCVPAFCPACGSPFSEGRATPDCKVPVEAAS